MGEAVFVARAVITNEAGSWDSLGPDGTSPRMKGKATFSLKEDPNELALEIYNLAPETVQDITGKVSVRHDWTPAERAELMAKGASTAPFETTSAGFGLVNVELSYGYADSQDLSRPAIIAALSQAFVGQIASGPTVVTSGQDQIVTMLALDGGQALGAGEVVQQAGGGAAAYRGKAYEPGTRIADILADLINSLGLGADANNLDAQIVQALAAKYPGAKSTIGGGRNSSGPAAPQIRQLMTSLDLRWTIQAGEFIVLDDNSVIPGFPPIILSSELGNIVGQPKRVGGDKLEVSTTANTEVLPGRPLDVSTETIQTSYRVDESSTPFDTYSGAQTDAKLDALLIAGVV